MKSREDKLNEALDSYSQFEGIMQGLEEAQGYVSRRRSGMSHEQAEAEAGAEAEERILARYAATQAAENKPANPRGKAAARKTTTRAPSLPHAPPTV